MKKLLLFISLATSLFSSYGMDCSMAKDHLIKAASAIRGIQQSASSFSLIEQDSVIDAEKAIVDSTDYKTSKSYYQMFCM